jgi:hypothetical protein
METPIVSYTQTLFKGTVTFRLFPDRLLMNGKVTFKSDYETSIPLASLDPEFATLNIRPRVFMSMSSLRSSHSLRVRCWFVITTNNGLIIYQVCC